MIDEIHLQYPFMGSRRVRTELAKKGHKVNRKRIVRIMREMGIGAIYPKPKTTLANKAHKVYRDRTHYCDCFGTLCSIYSYCLYTGAKC